MATREDSDRADTGQGAAGDAEPREETSVVERTRRTIAALAAILKEFPDD